MPDQSKLADFVAWAAKNIKGDEKGEAQIFLDRLFQAFGQGGSLDVGGALEFRIRKSGEDGGGTSFAVLADKDDGHSSSGSGMWEGPKRPDRTDENKTIRSPDSKDRGAEAPPTFIKPGKPLTANALAKINAVAEAGREVRRVRAEALTKLKGGLRALYRTLELPGANPLKDAHAALDVAVLSAYGFDAKQDLLAQLLALNQSVAARIESGEPVTAPGVPPGYPEPERLVTEDCIRAVTSNT